MNRRVCFFVDGFNLYHSLAQCALELGDASIKWQNLTGLALDSLHLIDCSARLRSIHYFTALPEHLHLTDPDKLQRHRVYLRALTAAGSIRPVIHHGRISQQKIRIQSDGREMEGRIWREKGTDVALAMSVMREAAHGEMDDAVIISGDSDYLPLVRIFQEMYPEKSIRFAFPRGRASKELQQTAPLSFSLTVDAYLSHRFPESIRLPSGKRIHRPEAWAPNP